MIHYHVWFSLKAGVAEAEGLARARAFIEGLTSGGKVARAMLLKNTGQPPKSRLLPYHALFEFRDGEQMGAAFAEQRKAGIHSGAHGKLLEAVAEFHVEVFEEV